MSTNLRDMNKSNPKFTNEEIVKIWEEHAYKGCSQVAIPSIGLATGVMIGTTSIPTDNVTIDIITEEDYLLAKYDLQFDKDLEVVLGGWFE